MPDINLANMAWWQARAEKAEAERDRLREALRDLHDVAGRYLERSKDEPALKERMGLLHARDHARRVLAESE